MPFYIRKAFNKGPFRLNLSKSGFGSSFGATGFRVGIRPDGSRYVHAGRYGLYFRDELKSPTNTNHYSQPHFFANDGIASDINLGNRVEIGNIDLNEFRDCDYEKILSCLTKSYSKPKIELLIIVLVFSFSIFVAINNNIAGIISFITSFISSFFLFHIYKARRSISLNYNDTEILNHNKSAIIDLHKSLSTIEKIYFNNAHFSYASSTSMADGVLDLEKAKIYMGLHKWLDSYSKALVIETKDNSVYFMPDGIFIRKVNRFGYIGYSDFHVNFNGFPFIESNPTQDTEIIKRDYDGSAIYLYGDLKILRKQDDEIIVNLITSNKNKTIPAINILSTIKYIIDKTTESEEESQKATNSF